MQAKGSERSEVPGRNEQKWKEDTVVITESTESQMPTIEHLNDIKSSLEEKLLTNKTLRQYSLRKIVALVASIISPIIAGLLILGWSFLDTFAFIIFIFAIAFISIIIAIALELGLNKLINKRVDKLIKQLENKLLICKICINCHYCTIIDDDYTTNVKKLMNYGFDPDFSQLSFSIAKFYREQYKALAADTLY